MADRSVYDVLGLMSGTSLDGLDILHVRFSRLLTGDRDSMSNQHAGWVDSVCRVGLPTMEDKVRHEWKFDLLEAETYVYPDSLRGRLASAMSMNGLDLHLLSVDLGHFIGKRIKDFVDRYSISPDFAAVHGQTIFHRPELGMTCQIGDGAAMAVDSGVVIVNDFRSTDVALGGQGAPLVPIGDHILFSDYEFCLNLGGISNISYQDVDGERVASDISLCNIALNHFSALVGENFDMDGNLARKGTLNKELFSELNRLEYYRRPFPKTLGYEYFQEEFLPLVNRFYPGLVGYPGAGEDFFLDRSISTTDQDLYLEQVCDILNTLCEHFAYQIGLVFHHARLWKERKDTERSKKENVRVLLTGGGALNLYLRDRIAYYGRGMSHMVEEKGGAGSSNRVVEIAPVDRKLIDYKEALIFAFLGVLRIENIPNTWASFTGARCNSIGGAVYLPPCLPPCAWDR